MTAQEALLLTPAQVKQAEADAEKANQKRLENIRNSMGVKAPQNITLDVTPAGVAARTEAIKAEEAKIAVEAAAMIETAMPSSLTSAVTAEPEVKKSKVKKKAKAVVAAA